jgi:hypothetical protein
VAARISKGEVKSAAVTIRQERKEALRIFMKQEVYNATPAVRLPIRL